MQSWVVGTFLSSRVEELDRWLAAKVLDAHTGERGAH